MCGVGINYSLSSFSTHQHRHASMERTDKQENNRRREPPNSADVSSADVSSAGAALAAGAGGLVCGCRFCDVPEA